MTPYEPPARPPADDTRPGEADQINLFWLIHLRWAAILGQVLTVLSTAIVLAIELPLGRLFAVMGLAAASNLHLTAWFRRRRSLGWEGGGAGQVAERLLVAVMIADVLLLFLLLYLTGGVSNPFSAFFLVHVVLAAVLLPPPWAGMLTGLAALCLWVLASHNLPLADLEIRPGLQLRGLVIALVMTAVFSVFFVSRVTRALEMRSTELAREREHQTRAERLEALGTLAAGAAHELSSPLSTIAVVAKELERRLVGEGAPEDDLADARLVRDEVARCRRILDRMTLESGDSAGEELVQLTVEELLAETIAEVPGADRVQVTVHTSARGLRLLVPRSALAMALRAVISNALDASGDEQRVELRAADDDGFLELVIEDRGTGMDPDHARRAADPFFTTKEPGSGMGLGLFLTRSVIERLGGQLFLASRPGEGTVVRVRLPLDGIRRPA